MPFLIPLLSALLPAVVKLVLPKVIVKAEDVMQGAPGEEKKQWVLECFQDVYDILKAKGALSEKWDSAFQLVMPKLSDWIEEALEKLKRKNAI